jgi:hypothetical protein
LQVFIVGLHLDRGRRVRQPGAPVARVGASRRGQA